MRHSGSKELALSIKPFQLELAQRTGQFFQSKDQIHFASHQAFFAHRRDPANRDCTEVNNEAKLEPFFSFQCFERRNYRRDLLCSRSDLAPIDKKTVAEILVNYPVVILDYLFA